MTVSDAVLVGKYAKSCPITHPDRMKNFDIFEFAQEDYRPATVTLVEWIEYSWIQ
jgi:hypothetical protein